MILYKEYMNLAALYDLTYGICEPHCPIDQSLMLSQQQDGCGILVDIAKLRIDNSVVPDFVILSAHIIQPYSSPYLSLSSFISLYSSLDHPWTSTTLNNPSLTAISMNGTPSSYYPRMLQSFWDILYKSV